MRMKLTEWAGPRPQWHQRILFVASMALGYTVAYLGMLILSLSLGLIVTGLAAGIVWLLISIAGMLP